MTTLTLEISEAKLNALTAVASRYGLTAEQLVRKWVDFLLESEIDILSSEKDVKLARERFRAALAKIPDVEPAEEDHLPDNLPDNLPNNPPGNTLADENALSDWNRPEEDDAWKHLQ